MARLIYGEVDLRDKILNNLMQKLMAAQCRGAQERIDRLNDKIEARRRHLKLETRPMMARDTFGMIYG